MPERIEIKPEEQLKLNLKSLNEILTDNPLSTKARYRKAKTLFLLNDNEKALKNINRAMKLDAANAAFSFLKSEILYKSGKLKEAIIESKNAAATGFENPLLYSHMAALYIEVDSLTLAEEYINEALIMVPDLTEALRLRGRLEMLTNKLDASLITLQKTLVLNKEQPETYDYLAKTYLKMNKLDSALIYTKKGFAYATEDNIGLWYNKGKIMERIGKTDSAVIIYNKILSLSPDANFVQEDLGEVYMNNGYFKKAVSAFEKAIEYNPTNKSFYLRAAYCLERLSDFKKAQELYLKAKMKFPAELEFSEGYNRMTYKLERQYRATSI